MRSPVDKVKQPKPSGAADAVLERIHRLMHRVRARQYRALPDGPHAITHMDSKVLGFFGHRPGATLSDLAAYSGRDKAQLARLVKGLREQGLLAVQDAAEGADRRTVRMALSAEGQALLRGLNREWQSVAQHATAGFSAAELAQLDALLARLEQNLADSV